MSLVMECSTIILNSRLDVMTLPVAESLMITRASTTPGVSISVGYVTFHRPEAALTASNRRELLLPELRLRQPRITVQPVVSTASPLHFRVRSIPLPFASSGEATMSSMARW